VKMVHTVTGPVAPDELGATHTHEHVLCDQRLCPRARSDYRHGDFMVLDDADRAVEELRRFYDAGGRAVVEVTSSGWGRDVKGLRNISERSGVRIVAMAGYYTEPCIPLDVDERSISELASELIEELTGGVEGTGIRAGILKSGIHYARIERVELKSLRAVARAALETGASITTHTAGGRRYEVRTGNHGRQHLRLLREEGVAPEQLIVGHVDERPDVNVLSELAELGCYIQFDVLAKEHWLLDETRAQLIKELIDRGHVQRLLVGTDRCRKKELYRELGGHGYTYTFDVFIDMLKGVGVTNTEVETMMVENPGRALAF